MKIKGKKFILIASLVVSLYAFTGCQQNTASYDENVDFGTMLAQAKGTTVTLFMAGTEMTCIINGWTQYWPPNSRISMILS